MRNREQYRPWTVVAFALWATSSSAEDRPSELPFRLYQEHLTADDQKRLARGQTANADAYRAYLKGRYYWNKRTSEGMKKAIDNLQQAVDKTLDMDPSFVLAHLLLSNIYEQKGMRTEAMEESLAVLSRDQPQWVPVLRKAYATSGWRAYGQKLVGLTEQQWKSKQGYVGPWTMAVLHARFDDKNKAFAWLERAYEERHDMTVALNVEPALDSLRSDARFDDLKRRVGLPP